MSLSSTGELFKMFQIKEELKLLPKLPGVYFMKDEFHKIIYIGKAKNLKNRVSSYFRSKQPHPRTRSLVSKICEFEVMVTKNEVEALLLESNLIKKHQPKYNILLRDDKRYPLIRIDLNSKWPRISKARQRKKDGATYIGPYINEYQLSKIIQAAYKIFPLVRCSPHEFESAKKPCNYYHMKMCLAPCSLDVKEEEYLEVIQDAKNFLEGKDKTLTKNIKDKMILASGTENYEQAAQYRDQLRALDKRAIKQAVVIKGEYNTDAVAFSCIENNVTICILSVKNENLIATTKYDFVVHHDHIEETIEQFLIQYYLHQKLPQHIFLPEGEFSIKLIESGLKGSHETIPTGFKVTQPLKGSKKQLIDIAQKNAQHFATKHQKQKEKSLSQLNELKKTLSLETYPKRIECIDISHHQSDSIVASCVCFIDTKPAKNQYRHYNLKTVVTQDDYKSIKEIVGRRLERAKKENDAPDLLVIDGGLGQLNAALQAREEAQFHTLEIVALAKQRGARFSGGKFSLERIFKENQKKPITLVEGSSTFRIMTQIRNEAHRFAISFHRLKKNKKFIESELDLIKGLGPKKKLILIEKFGTVEAIKRASLEALVNTKGIQRSLAENIFSFFRTE